MTAQILDGKATTAAIKSKLQERVAAGTHRDCITHTEAVLVGGLHPFVREVAGGVAPVPGDVEPTRAVRGS